MLQKKGRIFNKINLKDYTLELEKILEYKHFSETSKSYLLSMMYKIENSYKDYKTVKRFVNTKDKFIDDILYVIENKCNKINIKKLKELININKDELIKIDYEKGIISVIPNEELLLTAITRLDYYDWDYSKKNILMEKPINNLLNSGRSQNIVEEIKNFDGWAWNNSVGMENKKDLLIHVVYNNLIMMYGRELIENWLYTEMSCENYMKKLRNLLDRESGKEEVKEFFDSLLTISTLLYMDNKSEYIKALKKQEKMMMTLKNKKNYVSEINSKKKVILNEVKRIDALLKSNKELKIEFIKTNRKLPTEKRFYNISEFAGKLEKDRKRYLERIRKYNDMIQMQNLTNMKKETKEEYEYLKSLNLYEDDDVNIENAFINFQKIFLKLISIRLEKLKDKDSLINFIYLFRYYEFMPIDKENNIKDISKLKKQIEDIEKMIILKAINAKILSGIGNIVDVNLKIYQKTLFNTRIINLENIIIEPVKVENKIKINIYDGTTLENSILINISEPKKIGIKIKKKIEIFS